MSLSEALDITAIPLRGIINLLMTTTLFGVPIGVFFVGAFIVRMIMKFTFSVESEYINDSVNAQRQSGKGKGE